MQKLKKVKSKSPKSIKKKAKEAPKARGPSEKDKRSKSDAKVTEGMKIGLLKGAGNL